MSRYEAQGSAVLIANGKKNNRNGDIEAGDAEKSRPKNCYFCDEEGHWTKDCPHKKEWIAKKNDDKHPDGCVGAL